MSPIIPPPSQATASEIDRLIAEIDAYRDRDVSHAELGSVSGFQEAQAVRVSIGDYFVELLTLLAGVAELVDPAIRETVVSRIRDERRTLGKVDDEIDRLVVEGVHTTQYPNARDKLIRSLKERGGAAKLYLQPFEAAIRTKRLEQMIDAASVAKSELEAREGLARIETIVNEAKKNLANLQAQTMKAAVDASASSFQSLTQAHEAQEKTWFWIFAASALATLGALIAVLFWHDTSTSTAEVVFAIVRRGLLVSVAAVFLKIALTKFNLERNLRIIYAHRESVLAQYKIFESAIGDDTAAKNQFRLEIAKYIFSDPVTGYVTSASPSEINISPMVSLLEKVSGK